MVYAWVLAWRQHGIEAAKKSIWSRVAYALRYSHGATLTEIVRLEHDDLTALNNALSDIVQEENGKP